MSAVLQAEETIRREAFEQWIVASPYERDIARWPNNEREFAWPGQYKDIVVQLAWEAWVEGIKYEQAAR